MSEKRYAYVSALMNDVYIKGLKALWKSMKDVGTKYPLIVLCPENEKKSVEKAIRKFTNEIEVITAPDIELPNDFKFKNHYWKFSFYKLRVCGLTQYEKVVMIDADMILLKNIDDLFEWPHMSSVQAGHMVDKKWVDLVAGLMVLEPSKQFEKDLIDLIPQTITNREKEGLASGDQHVYYEYMPDWPQREELHIPEIYAMFSNQLAFIAANYLKNGLSDVKLVHFGQHVKPWNYKLKEKSRLILRAIKRRNFSEYKVYKKYMKYINE